MKQVYLKPGVIVICCLSMLFLGCQSLIPQSQLPVMVGTDLPPNSKITADNFTQAIELAQWIPPDYSGFISTIDISPDGKFVAAGFGNGSVSILDPQTGKALYRKKDKQHGTINVIRFVPATDELLLGYDDGTIILCQVDGTVIWEIETELRVSHLSVSPSRNTIAVTHPGRVEFFSTTDGNLLNKIEGTGAEFLSDEQFILGTDEGQVEVWQLEPMTLATTLDKANENATDVLLSPSKELILANSDNSRSSGDVRLIRVKDGHYITALWATKYISSIAFSPDSKIIATASLEDAAIQLWRAHDGALLSRLLGHTMPASALAFSADDKVLVSGAHDGTIRVWGIP